MASLSLRSAYGLGGMAPSPAPVTCFSLLEGALTLSLREEPLAPRVMLAVGREDLGLGCLLARVE